MTQEEMFNEGFTEWLQRINPDMEEIGTILTEKLSDQPEILIKSMELIEAWNGRAGFMFAEASSWVDKAKYVFLPERDGRREMDRKAELDHRISDFRAVRDKMEYLMGAIKQRLILGESVLAYQRQFRDPTVINKGAAPWGTK